MIKIKITKKITLDAKATILSAVKKLNEGEFRFQLVIDNNKILLGTITDGDIRRAILQGVDLESSVTNCMNKRPTVGKDVAKDDHKKLLNSIPSIIKFLPILDNAYQLKSVVTDEKIMVNKTVLIMAGGYGKRLGEKTKNIPKPLLKIGKKPMLELLLEKLEKANYNKIYISTHYLHDKIEKFIKKRKSKSAIKILRESKPLGTAGCIHLIPKNEYETITVINADIVSDIDFESLNSFHIERSNDITLTVAEYEHQIPFGVIDFDKKLKLKTINEKPKLKHFVLSGIYCLDKNICNLVKNEKLDMTLLISNANNLGKKIGIFPIHEYWKDVGSPIDYELVNNER